MEKVSLTVNGSDVQMNDFVQTIISKLLNAILESLTLEEEPKEAVFTIVVDK